jgi:nucleoside-specific outer membrane channel protein Tsx
MVNHSETTLFFRSRLCGGILAAIGSISAVQSVSAATWSDTALSWRYGTTFAEPFNNKPDGDRVDIAKNIVAITHSSGYKYGTNFVNVDVLLSDEKDPADGVAGKSGAQEIYMVYRNTVDFGMVSKKDLSFGPIKSFGLTAGFDVNTKNDGYGSRKRMAVLGPTVMFDVPGFAQFSILGLYESNSPNAINKRYEYDIHPAAELDWGIPIAATGLSFEGYALWIAEKGKDEFGGKTAPEFHIDTKLMYDLGATVGMDKNTFKVGAEYEYWRNKFGNSAGGAAGKGATASTPMIRAEYHF